MILIYRNVSKRDKRWVCGIIYESWVIHIKSTFRQLFFFLKVNNVSHKKRQKLKQKKTEEEFFFFIFFMGKWGKQKQAKQHRSVGGGALALYLLQRIKALNCKNQLPPSLFIHCGHTFCVTFRPHFLSVLPFFLWNYLMSFACTLCLV